MKFKLSALILILLILFSSCQRKIIIEETESGTESETETADFRDTSGSSGEDIQYIVETEEIIENPDVEPSHEHNMILSQTSAPTCSKNGYYLYICECGATMKQSIARLPHTPTVATCRKNSYCSVCGAFISGMLPHTTESGVCSLCGLDFSKEVRVSGIPINFGDSSEIIKNSFGDPNDIISEGSLISYIYNINSPDLTVLQLIGNKLVGIYSFDTSLVYKKNYLHDLSGYQYSYDCHYGETEIIKGKRITVFYDEIGSKLPFSVYLRNDDFEYNYVLDSNIYSNFTKHEKISFYILNAQRALNGLSPLKLSDSASNVARSFAAKLTTMGYFGHEADFTLKMRQAGINANYYGENISHSYENCFYLMCAYYNSAEHRHNILSSRYSHIGIAYYSGAVTDNGIFIPYTVIGAQEFYG